MGIEVDNSFTWVIKNFCSEESRKIYSDEFVIDGCKWRLVAFPKGNDVDHLSLYLVVAGSEYLPDGWRRHAQFYLHVVNQIDEKLSQTKATTHWFDKRVCDVGFQSMLSLNKLYDTNSGFLKNGEVKIVVDVYVLEVIAKLDVPEQFLETTKPLGESNDFLNEASLVKETMDVNGFEVLPSQVEAVRYIFKKHPETASELRPENKHLRSGYMNVLLSLIETMCQSAPELSKYDLVEASASLTYLKDAGMNLNWLEEKLQDVAENKEKEEACEIRVHKLEEELKELKLKCANVEAQLDQEKEELAIVRSSIAFDDIV